MKKCWANLNNDCSEKISREHIVSKGIFSNRQVTVEGGPWTIVGEEKDIGINALTSKVLCEKHNNQLSYIDSEGIRVFKILKKFDLLLSKRSKMRPRRWNKILSDKIDGYLFEKWLIKTTINISCISPSKRPLGIGFESDEMIPTQLVEIVFDKNEFQKGMGLHVAYGDNQKIYPQQDQVYCNFIEQNSRIAGSFFSFRNFRFFLSLTNVKDESTFKGLADEWGNPVIKRHPSKVNTKIGNHTSHSIIFKWHKQ